MLCDHLWDTAEQLRRWAGQTRICTAKPLCLDSYDQGPNARPRGPHRLHRRRGVLARHDWSPH
jgi:hypothetical protein